MFLALIASLALAAEPRLEDKWDLSAVYPSLEAWEAAMTEGAKQVESLADCKGVVAQKLESCVGRRFEALQLVSRLYVYAMNHSSEDTRNADWRSRSQRVELLYTRFGEVTAFYEPELVALGTPGVEAAVKAAPALAPYDYYLRSAARDGAHTLDAQREALLAATATVREAPGSTRSVLVNGELPWPTVTFADGTSVRLDPSAYTVARGRANRADRKLVFDSFFGALGAYKGTMGSLLDTTVGAHWFIARTRGYESSVAAAMDVGHLPPSIYTTLVETTNKNLPTLHRYLRLRAKTMGVSDLQYSDLYAPMGEGAGRTYTVDEAKALTLAACAPLGKEYTAVMAQGFKERWMDVYPQPGKRAGAYMDGGAPAVHPFILLNYGGDYESVSTLAHEWGHALHSALSAKAQPYAKADYATFIAEVASTFNEALLLDHMLKASKSDAEKLEILGHALEGLRTTYFRQAQLAEFELAIHAAVERGEPLTGDSLDAAYLDVLRRYYGEKEGVTTIDPKYAAEWSYIQHFYYNFYVYQYATSIAAASLLSEEVLQKRPGAVDRYLTLLKAGGSDDPYVLLKNAGVDMATPGPYDAIARRMDKIMDQIEALQAKKAAADKKAGGKAAGK